MDVIQKVLIKAGRKDLAQEYYKKIANEPLHSSKWIQSVKKWLSDGWLHSTYKKSKLPTDTRFSLKMINTTYPEKGIMTINIKNVSIDDVKVALANTKFSPEKFMDIYVSRDKAKIKENTSGVEIQLPVSNLDETFDWA
jgi:hypothetical protein